MLGATRRRRLGHTGFVDHNAELKEFLRTRRARLSVDEVEIGGTSGVRRVPGLRREEVAQLAGVSVDYHSRLEQGRNLNVSDEVLDAVARALRLGVLIAAPARRTVCKMLTASGASGIWHHSRAHPFSPRPAGTPTTSGSS
jgi:transcriptional regulator with XRE-family HTH domain